MSKTILYTLHACKCPRGEHVGKTVWQAMPVTRGRISFRSLCERLEGTTYNAHELMAALNIVFDQAKSLVEDGHIVELGDLGALYPSFQSEQVPLDARGENAFIAQKHIKRAVVKLRPNKRFFQLRDVHYRRTKPRPKRDGGQCKAK